MTSMRPGSLLSRTLRLAALLAVAGSPVQAARAQTQRQVLTPARAPAAKPPQASATLLDSIGDFAPLIARLSESGGYFDTDNLISNESSYLHVIGALERLQVKGGAYIGVGPDQNFSYIARIEPRIAFIVDIRRDNLLQHLLFKALFARSRNRVEYLALLLGRPVPREVQRLSDQTAEQLVGTIDALRATPASTRAAANIILAEVRRYGVPLTLAELATIQRFHAAFFAGGLSLQFTSAGRPPQWYYPTLRQLVLEKDLRGQYASYLARESDFQLLKSMQRRNLIVPVVGDLGGATAMTAVGRYIAQRGDKISAIYASNAEDYVMRGGGFDQYARSVLSMPRDARSVFIRSFFGGEGGHPDNVKGYYSTQLLQTIDDFAADMATTGYRSYRDLVRRHAVPLR